MKNEVKQVEKKERGASMVEYALLVALIAVVLIVGVTALSKNISQSFSASGSAIAPN